jgi:molybdate transport system substrate-binding protein
MLTVAGLGVGLLVTLLAWRGDQATTDERVLEVRCAAGMAVPLTEIAAAYEREYGVHIEFQFQGSNTLLTQMQVNKFDTADLFLAADDFYTEKARKAGLVQEEIPIAHMRPVLAIRKDCPKQISSLEDLLRPDVRVVLADPEQAAIGRAVKDLLEPIQVDGTNRWEQLAAHVTRHGVFHATIPQVAEAIQLGTNVDAGIIYDSTAAMPKYRDQLKAIPLPELDSKPDLVTISVLNSTRKPTAALKFARYVSARDRGLPTFQKYGLRPVEGDVWEETPTITFFCGAVNRRVVEPILADFQQREGVVIDYSYDGCGILTSRMKAMTDQTAANGFPDVYFACDVYYLDNVKEWFQEAKNVSEVEIVIAVPKGSTKVTSLADLIKPGIRVAVGEPNQCTLGALTRRILAQEGLYEELLRKQGERGEVVVEKASSAHLVPDVVTGHVDAAVAYISDVLANTDKVDIVRIESPLNKATQPFSIARNSEHKHLVRRLYQRIADSPEAFESVGFHFRGDQQPASAQVSGT